MNLELERVANATDRDALREIRGSVDRLATLVRGLRQAQASTQTNFERETEGAGRRTEELFSRNKSDAALIFQLDPAHLSNEKIVAHDSADPRSGFYDTLRAEVLMTATSNDWRVVGVTSPTPSCGKTLTAVNMALSMARTPDTEVLLVDMDLRRPKIANYLGITPPNGGVLDLVERRASLESSVVSVNVNQRSIFFLPTAERQDLAGLPDSDTLGALLDKIREHYPQPLIILNLPPMLRSDDVSSLLPHVDCVVLVAAVGGSKIVEIEECIRRLRSSNLACVVANAVGAL